MESFITLSNSNDSLTKKFRVLATGYRPVEEKPDRIELTVTGKIDLQTGPVVGRWLYTFKVYETDPTDPNGADGATEGYGTLAHLRTFFRYNDPGGTPSNVIGFTDFDETEHSVYIMNRFSPENAGYQLAGVNAQFAIEIEMVAVEALA
jgi:hypothetical protein